MSKIAVVVMNLGGPDSAEAVEPFLFNLFFDPAIIALPLPLRWAIAKLIAHRRAPLARQIYAKIDNRSPLLPNTERQAEALAASLGADFRVFIAMRYWAPLAAEAVAAVKQWGADEVVLLPLYPQFSSTTTASSIRDWHKSAKSGGLDVPTRAICCYPAEGGFIAALADAITTELARWPETHAKPRLLLSAHGLPQRIVAKGDPYQRQIEQTAAKLREALQRPDIDTVICYQSRVGPLEWLQPATDAEIRRAGAEKRGLIVAPIAFVSEHSETLVELDIEYGHLAQHSGVPLYRRVPTVGAAASFIGGLAGLVRAVRAVPAQAAWPAGGVANCGDAQSLCALRNPTW